MHSSISNSENQKAKLQLVLVVVFFLMIFIGGLLLHFSLPLSPRSSEHYSGVILDQQENLSRNKGRQARILLVGGSSLSFSVSADELTQQLGVQVMNLGVVAGMGYSNIWNNYRKHTDPEKDLIVLSPEYELLYVNKKVSQEQCNLTFLSKALSPLIDNPYCLPLILFNLPKDIWYHLANYRNEKDIYYRSAYNEYGDAVSHLGKQNRPFNPREGAFPGNVRDAHLDAYIDFVRSEMIAQGYQVIVIPTIIPVTACQIYEDRIKAIHDELAQLNTYRVGLTDQHSPVFCLPDEMFFDTAYHLNQEGRKIKTDIFAEYLEATDKESN